MVYPKTLLDTCKYYIFTIYNPIHPYISETLLALGIIRHDFRQDYLLGILKPEKNIDDLIAHLISHGFGNHFISWRDPGQIVSLRLATDFRHQLHLRIFTDGEVRGHYEYTPEFRPIAHLNETGFEDRREDFRKLLEGWLDEPKH